MGIASTYFTWDPLWPWSLPYFGILILIGVAGVLVTWTILTYAVVARVGWRRVLVLVSLRLLALATVFLVVLRVSLASQEDRRLPSMLLLLLDASESMTIRDEPDNLSRWESLSRTLDRCDPLLNRLRDEHQVSVHFHCFGAGLEEFDPKRQADGKRTDTGRSLRQLHDRYGQERHLRGLLVISDGADNSLSESPLTHATRWRALSCPIHTFAVGQTTTTSQQNDIVLTHIIPTPSPVPVKQRLKVKGILNAAGLENLPVTLRLFIDDRQVAVRQFTPAKSQGNEVELAADAPDMPGEIKVTLKADPVLGEVSIANNEISTYVTVVKEGVSVLLVDKLRGWEPQAICDVLRGDPRFRVYTSWLRGVAEGQPDPFQFDQQRYDVIILGDVSVRRLTGGQPALLEELRKQVRDGAGLLLMGGQESFGNSDWQGSALEDLSPVLLDARNQLDVPLSMVPTERGLDHYVLRLTDQPGDNAALWKQLPPLAGMTRLGRDKPGSVILANTHRGEPLLVGQNYGKGRTLAFAADTTWRWRNLGQPDSNEGLAAHARFWKQMVIWLAHQEEEDGNLWVKLDTRRVPAGGKLGFSAGLVGKGGVEISDPRFDVTVVGPADARFTVPVALDQGEQRGIFWQTDAPGEYRLLIRGSGKDRQGIKTSGETSARFTIYQDDIEMARQAADHEFLNKLALAGGGKAHSLQELPKFLEDLLKQVRQHNQGQIELWPDWRHAVPPESQPRAKAAALTTSGSLPVLLLFVGLLSLEWLLRRSWGLV